MSINKIYLKDEDQYISIRPLQDNNGLLVIMHNTVLKIDKCIGMWYENKWVGNVSINYLTQLCKKYPALNRLLINAQRKYNSIPKDEITYSTTWNCFKRKFKLIIHNTIKNL